MTYDSTNETNHHIEKVQVNLCTVIDELRHRADVHDESKLDDDEKPYFDEWTPRLRDMTYNSDEYKAALVQLKPALDHHYAVNSHHPEHFRWHCPVCNGQFNNDQHEAAPQGPNDSGVRYCPRCCRNGMLYESELMLKPNLGVNGMTLLDLVEMFCDWKAATERHADGSLERSIQQNQNRFEMAPQLARIFENTRVALGW